MSQKKKQTTLTLAKQFPGLEKRYIFILWGRKECWQKGCTTGYDSYL